MTDEQCIAFVEQHRQIFNGLRNGTLPYERVMSALKRIAKGDFDVEHVTAFVSYQLPTFAELNGTLFDDASEVFNGSYTWEDHEFLRGRVDRTPGERTFLVKGFNKEMQSKDVLIWADAHGYRAATHEEVVDVAKEHPDILNECWIVALASFVVHAGRHIVAVLRKCGGERSLGKDLFVGKWNADCSFLLVRK